MLEHIDLTIEQGSFVALLGHNGCGKSTIAKHFNAMLLPTGGTVLVKEMNTSDEALKYEVRRTVGMVLQNPDNQLVSTIVEEDVAFGPENLGVPAGGNPPPGGRRPAGGGYVRLPARMRLISCRAVRSSGSPSPASSPWNRSASFWTSPPPCWIPRAAGRCWIPSGRLNKERGITIVLITHYMDEAVQADRVVVMDDGADPHGRRSPGGVLPCGRAAPGRSWTCPSPPSCATRCSGRGLPLPEGVLTAAECAEAIALLPVSGRCAGRRARCARPRPPGGAGAGNRGADLRLRSPAPPLRKTAMHDVSLTVNRGDFVGIIGHTGSGKSTLVQHLNGLLRPTSGRVLLEGRDIWEDPKKIRAVRFRVGMVFQYPEHQLFEDTCYKDIAFGPKNMGLSEEEIDKRVRQAAAFVGLREELLEKSPFELSGGEKRRAAIAGVMAMEPEVLILDEPTAGLDPKGRDTILEQIRVYQEQRGTTVLLVSHSMEDIARVAKRVLVMNRGEVAMYAPTEEVFSRAAELEAIGLSIPAVTRVFMRLRDKGLPVGDNVYTVEQAAARLLPLLKGGDTPC